MCINIFFEAAFSYSLKIFLSKFLEPTKNIPQKLITANRAFSNIKFTKKSKYLFLGCRSILAKKYRFRELKQFGFKDPKNRIGVFLANKQKSKTLQIITIFIRFVTFYSYKLAYLHQNRDKFAKI